MSLKGFHIIFIIASILMAFGFAYWAYFQNTQTPATGYIATAIISTLIGVGLVVYEVNFIRKNETIQ